MNKNKKKSKKKYLFSNQSLHNDTPNLGILHGLSSSERDPNLYEI